MHGHDVSLFLWSSLSLTEGRSDHELSVITGFRPQTVRRKLAVAQRWGLALVDPDGRWRAGKAKLGVVASKTGARRRQNQRVRRRAAQRARYVGGYAHLALTWSVYRYLEYDRWKTLEHVAEATGHSPRSTLGQLGALLDD